jgi:hypothetical protein
MSLKPSVLAPINDWIAKHYGKDTGKMLIHTGVIGWALSAAAQVTAICVNDKISKKQKMFMIPQEIADAFVNIISFYAITQTCKSFASKLVKTGKLLPKSVREVINAKGLAEKCGKLDFNIYKDANLSPSAIKRLTSFHNGVDVVATTAGSVLSCNIVTPIVRNYIAANRQKSAIAKMDAKSENNPSYSTNSNIYYPKTSMTEFLHGSSLKI